MVAVLGYVQPAEQVDRAGPGRGPGALLPSPGGITEGTEEVRDRPERIAGIGEVPSRTCRG